MVGWGFDGCSNKFNFININFVLYSACSYERKKQEVYFKFGVGFNCVIIGTFWINEHEIANLKIKGGKENNLLTKIFTNSPFCIDRVVSKVSKFSTRLKTPLNGKYTNAKCYFKFVFLVKPTNDLAGVV